MSFEEFILAHEGDDLGALALARGRYAASVPDFDLALNTLEARRKLRDKVPEWYAVPALVYPLRLSAEQCSSTSTALYKACVALTATDDTKSGQNKMGPNRAIADLTGGLGVDSWAFSKRFGQVLYNENKPWLFVPIAPLFIEKGNYTERVNNGALALDMNYRLFNAVRLYGEFFLDDLESPNAVYENKYSNNRWAGMLGLQAGHDFYIGQKRLNAGTIAEIARVEPYTYCHYDTAHAQLANLGAPLGNPNGPNSLAVDWTVYAQADLGSLGQLFAGVHQKWLWKGTDAGSNIEDPYKTVRKRFAHGAPLVYTVAPSLGYNGRFVGFSGELTLGDSRAADIRVSFMW